MAASSLRVLGPNRRASEGSLQGGALHVAVSRSSVVRLTPVADALADIGVPQALLDPSGEVIRPSAGHPPRTLRLRDDAPPAMIASAVASAIERLAPSVVLTAGDDEAAVAAAFAAAGSDVPVARLGAGVRCDDRTVAGEVNRVALDALADLLLVEDAHAAERLQAEGASEQQKLCVGSTIPDVVDRWRAQAVRRAAAPRLGLGGARYVLVSIGKPCNAGDPRRARQLVDALCSVALRRTVVISLERALDGALATMGGADWLRSLGFVVVGPLDYVDFLSLQARADAVLTDSAAVQEETTVLGVPCWTLGRTSERTWTLTHGTNTLLAEPSDVVDALGAHSLWPPEPVAAWEPGAGRRAALGLVRELSLSA